MSTATTTHLLRERKGTNATSKCGEAIKPEQATVWATDVTCPTCLEHMAPLELRKRVVQRTS